MYNYDFSTDRYKDKPKPKKRTRWQEYTPTEQEKLMKELRESYSMPMLIMAAQNLGWKPKTHFDAQKKQAQAASIYVMSCFLCSPNDSLGSFVRGLVLENMCRQEYVPEFTPYPRKR